VRGEVIGINARSPVRPGSIPATGLQSPFNIAKTVMTQLIADRPCRASVIGVSVLPVRQEDAEDVKLPDIKARSCRDSQPTTLPPSALVFKRGYHHRDRRSAGRSGRQLQQRIGLRSPVRTVQVLWRGREAQGRQFRSR